MVRNRVVPASRSGRASRTGGSVVRLGRSDIGARVAVPAATDTGLRPPTSAVLHVHGSGSVKSPFCAFWRNRLGGTLKLPVKWLVNEPHCYLRPRTRCRLCLPGWSGAYTWSDKCGPQRETCRGDAGGGPEYPGQVKAAERGALCDVREGQRLAIVLPYEFGHAFHSAVHKYLSGQRRSSVKGHDRRAGFVGPST